MNVDRNSRSPSPNIPNFPPSAPTTRMRAAKDTFESPPPLPSSTAPVNATTGRNWIRRTADALAPYIVSRTELQRSIQFYGGTGFTVGLLATWGAVPAAVFFTAVIVFPLVVDSLSTGGRR
jgi:hypothetical protein